MRNIIRIIIPVVILCCIAFGILIVVIQRKADDHAGKNACKDEEMIQAQDFLLDSMYMNPAVDFADTDGLSALGQYIYYDAMVVHGPGDDEDSFNGIRMAAQKNALPPSQGGEEL